MASDGTPWKRWQQTKLSCMSVISLKPYLRAAVQDIAFELAVPATRSLETPHSVGSRARPRGEDSGLAPSCSTIERRMSTTSCTAHLATLEAVCNFWPPGVQSNATATIEHQCT